MIANSGATFPILYTTESEEVPRAYDVYDLHDDGVAAPAAFIVDKNGTIVFEYIGNSISDRPDTSILIDELKKLSE